MLATYNGAGTLRRVLEAYSMQSAEKYSWQLVIVDNASQDETPRLLAEYLQRLPLTILYEPHPGKNRALNRGLDFLGNHFGLLVLTDDDAVPAPGFLDAWWMGNKAAASADLMGGVVEPEFGTRPPQWLSSLDSQFDVLYARNKRPSGPVPADAIYGPNMAVRARVFQQGFRFLDKIGPNSSDAAYPMGSETEFCQRVERLSKARSHFLSEPQVRHIVRPNQMTEEFVYGRARRSANGRAARDLMTGAPLIRHSGARFWATQAAYATLAKLGSASARWEYTWKDAYRQAIASGLQPSLTS